MPIVRKLLDADDKGYPTRVAYSPDGARLAVLGTNKRMTMVPLAGGKSKGVSGPAWGPLAFSHDGALIVLGERTTSVFDATSLKKVWSTKSDAATCAAFSPDGVTLAVGGTTTYGIVLLHARTGEKLGLRLQWSAGSTRALQFSHDGDLLFSAVSLGCVERYVMKDGSRTTSPREPWVESLAILGDRIASGGETWPSGEHPVTGKWPAKMHVTLRSVIDLAEVATLPVGDGVEIPGGPTGSNGRIASVRFVKETLVALYNRSDGACFVHRWDAAGNVLGVERLSIGAVHLDVAPDGTHAAIAAKDGVWLSSLTS